VHGDRHRIRILSLTAGHRDAQTVAERQGGSGEAECVDQHGHDPEQLTQGLLCG